MKKDGVKKKSGMTALLTIMPVLLYSAMGAFSAVVVQRYHGDFTDHP